MQRRLQLCICAAERHRVATRSNASARLATGEKIASTATADAVANVNAGSSGAVAGYASADATADARYLYRLNNVDSTRTVLQVPIFVEASAAARAGKSGNAGAGVVFGPIRVAETGELHFGETATSIKKQRFDLVPGVNKLVISGASCSAEAFFNSEASQPTDSCFAAADPSFAFDQETFDARMGDQTFPLAEAYEMEFSPNLATPYSLNGSWSELANPNGVWSLREGENLLPHVDAWEAASFSAPQPGWARSADGATRLPVWMQMSAPFAPSHDWQEGDVVVHTTDDTNGVGSGPARVVWTSPSTGTINVFGSVWMGREIGRANHWELAFNDVPLTSGDIASGDAYDRENPFEFAAGSAGPSTLENIPIVPGDTLALTITKTSQYGDYVGVDLTVDVVPEPSQASSFAASALALRALYRRRQRSGPTHLEAISS